MNTKISVIVLIYNKETYLRKCVDSILKQSYQDFEILLIDDGSTDASASLCDEYARKEEKVRVFHKENGGLCDARNYGIKHATGEYLAFVDADDYLTADHLQNFNPGIEADAYIQALTLVEDGKKYTHSFDYMSLENPSAIASFFKKVLPYSPIGFALRTTHSILYRKSSLKDLLFDVNVGCIEDYLFNVKFFQTINSAVVVPGCGYHYVLDNAILSKQTYDVNSYIDWNRQLQNEIYNLCQKWSSMDMFREIVFLRFFHIVSIMFTTPNYSIKDKYLLYKFVSIELKKHIHENVPLNKKMGLIQKLPTSKMSFGIMYLLYWLRGYE